MVFRFAFVLALLLAFPAMAGGIDPMMRACVYADDEAQCEATQKSLAEDWKNANKGDYQGQRNIAFCLTNGCQGALIVNDTSSCAWWMVIMGSDAAFDDTDVSNYRRTCAGVRRDATAMAKILFKKIYKRRMPDIE